MPRGTRFAAGAAVAETPAERWRSQEGPTPKLEAVRGTNVAPLGTPAFRVGPRVRISFAPAVSLQTLGPSRCRCTGPFRVLSGKTDRLLRPGRRTPWMPAISGHGPTAVSAKIRLK
jgi:hypothetical protein